jgi:LacI family transcriptional regulator
VDRDIPDSGLDGVFSDNIQGAYEGVTRFIEIGHRKIATVTGPMTSKPGKERFEGYLMAMQDAGIKIPERYIMYGDFRINRAYECMNELLEADDPPTAVFASNNLSTLGCIKSINEKGYKLGQDISILGFDEIEALQIANIEMSVIDRNVNQIGREAMHILLKRLKGAKTEEVMRKVLPCELILREEKRAGS